MAVATTAVVDPRAQIDVDVEIGPFCVVGPDVRIGRGTRLENTVTLMGRVTLGQYNHIFPGTVIGAPPQDISYRGEDTAVEIGDHNVIRESVTINRATTKEDGVTSIGDHCYLMASSHVAHDCRLASRIIMANATLLGGHVHVHDDATLSGGSAVHHFTTIGSFSFVGGLSRVLHDVPPFMLVEGQPTRPRCVNIVALKRNDFPADTIRALTEAYKLIYRSKVGVDHAREILRSNGHLVPAVNHLLGFIQSQHEGRHGRGRERRRAA
ncbi:MAG: acyl-ACP--UDP-N-acetylglucosamine O-acyltransferase [Planctomycetales bacterium]|nr:acyl-ACP--UDP-N-acetylglucosamine O-acyltransferase [Planctomycetales bacterium]